MTADTDTESDWEGLAEELVAEAGPFFQKAKKVLANTHKVKFHLHFFDIACINYLVTDSNWLQKHKRGSPTLLK